MVAMELRDALTHEWLSAGSEAMTHCCGAALGMVSFKIISDAGSSLCPVCNRLGTWRQVRVGDVDASEVWSRSVKSSAEIRSRQRHEEWGAEMARRGALVCERRWSSEHAGYLHFRVDGQVYLEALRASVRVAEGADEVLEQAITINAVQQPHWDARVRVRALVHRVIRRRDWRCYLTIAPGGLVWRRPKIALSRETARAVDLALEGGISSLERKWMLVPGTFSHRGRRGPSLTYDRRRDVRDFYILDDDGHHVAQRIRFNTSYAYLGFESELGLTQAQSEENGHGRS